MTATKAIIILRAEIYELMGVLSVEEIIANQQLIIQIECVLKELKNAVL